MIDDQSIRGAYREGERNHTELADAGMLIVLSWQRRIGCECAVQIERLRDDGRPEVPSASAIWGKAKNFVAA